MPTFADLWNANPPPDVQLSQFAKTIVVDGVAEDEVEVRLDYDEDEEMEDAAKAAVFDVRTVRDDWVNWKQARDPEVERQWGDAMDIDYQDQVMPSGRPAHMMIVDTNVLLSHLQHVQSLSRVLASNPGPPILELVVPGIVLQELDAQTKYYSKPGLQDAARKATYWLLTELRKRKVGQAAVVRVQKDYETYMVGVSWKLSNKVNDDLILDCCQYFASRNTPVGLLTDDQNLSVKALTHDIPAMVGKTLTNIPALLRDIAPGLDVNRLLRSSGMSVHASTNRTGRGKPPRISWTPPYTPENGVMPLPPTSPNAFGQAMLSLSTDSMDIDMENAAFAANMRLPPSMLPPSIPLTMPMPPFIGAGPSYPETSAPSAMLSTHPQNGASTQAVGPPPSDNPELVDLLSSFRQYVAARLPEEVIAIMAKANRAGSLLNPSSDPSIYGSIHAPTQRLKGQKNKGKGRACAPLPSESVWRKWSAQHCIEELRKLRPAHPPTCKIDWYCLESFLADEHERGYRPDGGSPADWTRAIFMLRAVMDAYDLTSITIANLSFLEECMKENISVDPHAGNQGVLIQ